MQGREPNQRGGVPAGPGHEVWTRPRHAPVSGLEEDWSRKPVLRPTDRRLRSSPLATASEGGEVVATVALGGGRCCVCRETVTMSGWAKPTWDPRRHTLGVRMDHGHEAPCPEEGAVTRRKAPIWRPLIGPGSRRGATSLGRQGDATKRPPVLSGHRRRRGDHRVHTTPSGGPPNRCPGRQRAAGGASGG